MHWSEQKFIISICRARAPGRAVGDVYVYPQYTGFIAICAARSYAVQRSTKRDYDFFLQNNANIFE